MADFVPASPAGAADTVAVAGAVSVAGAVPVAGAAAFAGAAVGVGAEKAGPTTPPRMTIGFCSKPWLASGLSGIAATFSSVTSGCVSPSPTTDCTALAVSAVFSGLAASSLMMDGVEDGTPGKTSDDACAPPVTTARTVPSRIRTDTMIAPLCPEAAQ